MERKIRSYIEQAFKNSLLSRKYNKNNKAWFELNEGLEVLKKCNEILCEEPSILDLEYNITDNNRKLVVVGDIHGNFESLYRIFEKQGYPPETKYIFLGDYVDRGEHSLEVIMFLYCLKITSPTSIYLIRGNHEFKHMTQTYGFQMECYQKGANELYEKIIDTFRNLPLAAILNDEIFCVHGGITALVQNISELKGLKKSRRGFLHG